MVIYILVIMVLIFCLYYLYNWLYGASDVQDVVIWQDPTVGLSTGKTTVSGAQNAPVGGQTFNATSGVTVPYIYSGGEYTVSTWIYVTKWDTLSNKPFLTLSGGGSLFNTLVLFLGKNTNKLGVRVSTNTSSLDYGTSSSDYAKMMSQGPNYTDSDMPKCDIEEINLQRWVNITVVMMGRTVDVYIDGKLSRSSVLTDFFKSDGDSATPASATAAPPQKITLGDSNSFSGYIGMTRAANVAYTPDRVYANYLEGPFQAWSLSSLNPGQYSLTLKRNSSVIFSTA